MTDRDLQFGLELERAVDGIRSGLDATNQAREIALPLSRVAVRCSANCIRAVHRGEIVDAEKLLKEARSAVEEMAQALCDFPQIDQAGFVHDAQKEYAEAAITLALIVGRDLPTVDELGIRGTSYLHGLAEAIGELRRHVLDSLRIEKLERCETLLDRMDDIYGLLVTIDYPDAMTGNLRRATDVARSILERTRGDLTLAAQQQRLARRFAAFENGSID
jgi:translin